MRCYIEVEDQDEAELIRRALSRNDVRAFVKIVGALEGLPSDRARRRRLQFVVDKVREDAELAAESAV